MSAVLQFSYQFRTIVCYRADCGITFAIPEYLDTQLRRQHQTFYCPHGHGQMYSGKSDVEKAREETERVRREKDAEIARANQRREWAEENEREARKRAMRQERRASAFKGQVTRTKKRVGNGVCPCCNRTFKQLAAHMATKHPTYKDAKVTP